MTPSVRERLAQARAHVRRGELAAAEPLYRVLLVDHPGFADVHNELGLLLHEKGDYGAAEAEFRRALEINPRYTEAALHLSIVQNDVGRYDEAREAWGRAAARAQERSHGLEPLTAGKIANLYADIGEAFAASGQLGRAVKAFREALELGPNFHDIRQKLAQALQDSGDTGAAVEELERLISLAPELVGARVALGVARFARGDKDLAVDAWKAVLAQHPDEKRAAMYLRLAGVKP